MSETDNKYYNKLKPYLNHIEDRRLGLIKKAIDFAVKWHSGQSRLSGEPYIEHVINVAIIVAQIGLDHEAIIACILHDVLEDTPARQAEIKKLFGGNVLRLVEGLTKLDRIRISSSWLWPIKTNYREVDRYENQAETLRKMFLAMSKDLRVIIIKLSDRLSNLTSLQYLSKTKRERIAKETLDIYAPIANRLGMGDFRGQLEDLAFPHLYPEEYKWLRKLAVPEIDTRKKYLKKVAQKLSRNLSVNRLKPKIIYRAKRWYSLYQKLLRHNNDIKKIYDLVAIRIIVPSVEDCYNVLGQIHSLWQPIPGRIKDYIALPKPNGYRSIHTTVFCDKGVITEFQIRTVQMDRQAEFGIAAHWHYSEHKSGAKIPKVKLQWVNELARWQSQVKSAKDFKDALKMDFFSDRIFVFTPKGEIKDLPAASTPVDFAYSIHSAVGNQCAGAKINGKMTSIDTELFNGDVVEIIKNNRAKPNRDWLKFVKTEHARSCVRKIVG